jgi:hypothetical protein
LVHFFKEVRGGEEREYKTIFASPQIGGFGEEVR